jgi:hypothetical protein
LELQYVFFGKTKPAQTGSNRFQTGFEPNRGSGGDRFKPAVSNRTAPTLDSLDDAAFLDSNCCPALISLLSSNIFAVASRAVGTKSKEAAIAARKVPEMAPFKSRVADPISYLSKDCDQLELHLLVADEMGTLRDDMGACGKKFQPFQPG